MAFTSKVPVSGNPEFCFSPEVEHRRNRVQEFIIRYTGITVVSVISVLLDFGSPASSTNFPVALLVSFIRTALLWNGSMYVIQFIVNRYASLNNMRKVVWLLTLVLAAFVVLVESGEILASERFLGVSLSPEQKKTQVIVAILITFMISAIYSSVAFFMQWKDNLHKAQELGKANLEARYETLRNQVNPHFLFNSLNTLLTLVKENPVAVQYVESISDIMRYMIQSNEKETVLLRDELAIAREYVFIQQKRFGEKLQVRFDIEEKYFHYAIPPLTLQMLLENALKHNVISKEHPLEIEVTIAENQYISVENLLSEKTDKEPSTGIGLVNIRARYIHLSGKDIIVRKELGKFKVWLPLFEKPI